MFFIFIPFLVGFVTFVCVSLLRPYYRQYKYIANAKANNLKAAPLAPGCWPLVGHGLSFSKDIYGYIQHCYNTLGPVFRLQIYRSEFIVICDRSLIPAYFKSRESNMSLYDALKRIYFGDAFSNNPESLETIIRLVKSTIQINYDTFVPKIVSEAQIMIQRLRDRSQGLVEGLDCEMKQELIRFVARTSAQCFISVDLSEKFFTLLMEFTDTLNELVVMTYFMPRWLIKITFGRKLIAIRKQLTDQLDGVIQTYRDDPEKTDSRVFRKAVDWVDPVSGKSLTNTEVAEIVICLLYVSSENTALGLTNLLIDLVQNPEFGDRVRNLSRPLLEQGDFKALFANSFLDSCLMESARMNTHIFPLNRQSKDANLTLGDYWIGDTECVAICEPMLMKDPDCAKDMFDQPQKYNPDRFEEATNKQAESKGPRSIMTWGAGVHLCPGKNFAIYEMKVGIAYLLNTFQIHSKSVGPLEYFSPSAYAERSFHTTLKLLPEPVKLVKQNTGKVVERMTILGQNVWIIREGCSPGDQNGLYRQSILNAYPADPKNLFKKPLYDLVTGAIPEDIAWPIGWQNLAYTGTSTMDCTSWLKWANQLVKKLDVDALSQTFSDPNSVYIQLYGADSSMKPHKDQHVDWGISVSLGASCRMQLGDQELLLHSGDVLICDFSALEHSVKEIMTENIPSWFNPEVLENLEKDSDDYYETWGRVRCSVQIRALNDQTKLPPASKLLTNTEFLDMLRKQSSSTAN